jgi:citrate lyase alpha subunit
MPNISPEGRTFPLINHAEHIGEITTRGESILRLPKQESVLKEGLINDPVPMETFTLRAQAFRPGEHVNKVAVVNVYISDDLFMVDKDRDATIQQLITHYAPWLFTYGERLPIAGVQKKGG